MGFTGKTKKIVVTSAVAVGVAAAAAGCSFDKATEPYQDAPRTGTVNSSAADVVTGPDGFSNVSTKCDHGNRIYVAYHGDADYAAIAVVPQDPTCK